jgi:hypothetical protein
LRAGQNGGGHKVLRARENAPTLPTLQRRRKRGRAIDIHCNKDPRGAFVSGSFTVGRALCGGIINGHG